jgi:uncharacterized membrane protein YedE/YeeE
MLRALCGLLAGLVFGAGLWLSGMTDTARVQGFLDLRAWDPTLAFVMGGAMIPMALAWTVARRRPAALLGGPFPAKPAPVIDARLTGGSVLFGIGWGLVGLCPGPAFAVAGLGGGPALVFLLSMGAGMLAAKPLRPRTRWTSAA